MRYISWIYIATAKHLVKGFFLNFGRPPDGFYIKIFSQVALTNTTFSCFVITEGMCPNLDKVTVRTVAKSRMQNTDIQQQDQFLWNRWTEFSETWQRARSQRPLPSLFFFLWPISKQKWSPWPIRGGTLYSDARYVALLAHCLLPSDLEVWPTAQKL